MIGFNSQATVVGHPFSGPILPDHDVKAEPMFFNAGLEFAQGAGGKITRSFIAAFQHAYPEIDPADCVFDSRVHMLMKGWFPCIPGWHHDDIARGANGQPDYHDMPYRSQHVMGLVNGHVCPTDLATGAVELSDPESHDLVYKAWHAEVEKAIEQGALDVSTAPSGRLIHFDWQTFHQGTRAVADGWRWFGRISWDTDRSKHVTNEMRSQVQVYLENPFEGW